jgi:hypothetical protein
MWKLGLRPRYSFPGNICLKFSAFCLCSVAQHQGYEAAPYSSPGCALHPTAAKLLHSASELTISQFAERGFDSGRSGPGSCLAEPVTVNIGSMIFRHIFIESYKSQLILANVEKVYLPPYTYSSQLSRDIFHFNSLEPLDQPLYSSPSQN